MNASSPAHCRLVTVLLQARDGEKTRVELSANRALDVFNIAWGDDFGDAYEHITSNVSPDVEGASIDLFFTDEVTRIIDPVTGAVLWEADGAPKVR